MSALAKAKMTVDEYLSWAEAQEGRWELIDGRPVAMSPERIVHNRVKSAAFLALRDAIKRAGAPCETLTDGMTVRISKTTAYEPDAMVRCGPRLPNSALEVADPIIVVEVVSPSSAAQDYGEKVDGYFSVPSVQHYLILSPEQRQVIHCRRGQGDEIVRRPLAAGTLRLDPPGLDIPVESLFGEP